MPDCVFCKIAAGQIPDYRVWEDENFLAFLDIQPVKPGHVLIIPRAHTDYIFDLPDRLYTGIFLAGRKLAPAIKKVTAAKKIGLSVVGVDVPHAHLHLIPLDAPGDMDFSRARPVEPAILRAMQERLTKVVVAVD